MFKYYKNLCILFLKRDLLDSNKNGTIADEMISKAKEE
jgi:hypothetical protein